MIIKEIKKQDPEPGSLTGLRDYLETNKKDHRLERIADRFLFNCRQDFDIGGACFEMMAVASRNERCKKSSRYAHYVISLREGESLTHDEWQETLKAILKRTF